MVRATVRVTRQWMPPVSVEVEIDIPEAVCSDEKQEELADFEVEEIVVEYLRSFEDEIKEKAEQTLREGLQEIVEHLPSGIEYQLADHADDFADAAEVDFNNINIY